MEKAKSKMFRVSVSYNWLVIIRQQGKKNRDLGVILLSIYRQKISQAKWRAQLSDI